MASQTNTDATTNGDGARALSFLSEQEQDALSERRKQSPWIDEILRQLERMTRSPILGHLSVTKGKLSLEYVVKKTILGRQRDISDRKLGETVWGEPNFEPTISNKVREAMRDLRDRMTEYNATEGEFDSIRIEIFRGSYVPHFKDKRKTVIVTLLDDWNPRPHLEYLRMTIHQAALRRLNSVTLVRAIESGLDGIGGEIYLFRGALACNESRVWVSGCLSDLSISKVISWHNSAGGCDDALKIGTELADAIAERVLNPIELRDE